MELNEYQAIAKTTALYPKESAIIYPALGLTGEAGEVAEKVKKMIRDDGGEMTDERRELLKKELGDVLWYISAIATDLDLTLEEIAQHNANKLRSRMEQNLLQGDGDTREELTPPLATA